MIALCLYAGSLGVASEVRIKEKDVPPAIMTAFHKAYPHAVAKGFTKETEKGTTLYEVESLDGTVKRDLLYSKDGTLKEIEEGIAVRALPEAVSASLSKSFPKTKILSAEKLTIGNTIHYECVVADGKQRKEIVLSADGRILKSESNNGEHE
jgi:hypothetical protein